MALPKFPGMNWAGNMNPDSILSIQVQTDSEARTRELASALAQHLQPGDVIALDGPMGSGKTCFVRGLAMGLNIDLAHVSSPTYIIRQEYPSPSGPPLTHIDAYRIHSEEELETIGWEEMLETGDSIVAVEWSQRIADALPPRRINITFAHIDLNSRDISISVAPELADRIAHLTDLAPTKCPTCANEVSSNLATFHFCSERCRLVDLGKWFDGKHSFSRPLEEDDLYE